LARQNRLIEAYLELRGQLARLVMRIVPPREIEDIVQETYVRICRVDDQELIREPRSYLFRTARNLALDHVKRSESRLTAGADIDELPLEEMPMPSEADPTYRQAASDEEFALFCEAVRSLPRQCRRTFVLKKVYGYTLQEIMAEMGLAQATVETHITNGTKRCVQYMRKRQEARQPAIGQASGNTNPNSSMRRRREGA